MSLEVGYRPYRTNVFLKREVLACNLGKMLLLLKAYDRWPSEEGCRAWSLWLAYSMSLKKDLHKTSLLCCRVSTPVAPRALR